jgi:hypothetical protein
VQEGNGTLYIGYYNGSVWSNNEALPDTSFTAAAGTYVLDILIAANASQTTLGVQLNLGPAGMWVDITPQLNLTSGTINLYVRAPNDTYANINALYTTTP